MNVPPKPAFIDSLYEKNFRYLQFYVTVQLPDKTVIITDGMLAFQTDY